MAKHKVFHYNDDYAETNDDTRVMAILRVISSKKKS